MIQHGLAGKRERPQKIPVGFFPLGTVSLPLKEFELLGMLLRNSDRVLTRGQLIIDRVWGVIDYVGDAKTLDVHGSAARLSPTRPPRDPRHPSQFEKSIFFGRCFERTRYKTGARSQREATRGIEPRVQRRCGASATALDLNQQTCVAHAARGAEGCRGRRLALAVGVEVPDVVGAALGDGDVSIGGAIAKVVGLHTLIDRVIAALGRAATARSARTYSCSCKIDRRR